MAMDKKVIKDFIDEVLDGITGDDEITLKVERPTIEDGTDENGFVIRNGAGFKTLTLTITQYDRTKSQEEN